MKPIEINGKLYTLTKPVGKETSCTGCAFDSGSVNESGCQKTNLLCMQDMFHVWEPAKSEGDKQ